MNHVNAIDLLRDASRVLPVEWIMQVYEMYRLNVTSRPGIIRKLPGEAYDGAVAAMDDAGWLNEEGELFIPDKVYDRIQSEVRAEFTTWVGANMYPDPKPTSGGAVPDQSFANLGYHCALHVWCATRGLL